MLERITHPNGVVTYRSPLLCAAGVAHGFSTRQGGVSGGVFAALNLGNPAGEKDTESNLQENHARLQRAIGAEGMPRAWVKQVHGRRVELLEAAADVRGRFNGQLEADGMVTARTGVLLTIRVADCVPVLLAAEDGTVVGAAHAGWRGVVAGVLESTLERMHAVGVMPERVVAAIGPGIGGEHFEVGEEVAAEFVRAGLGAAVRSHAGGKPHVDLQGAVRRLLERAGVRRIDGNVACTFRDAAEFFSHRREKGRTGRMAAVIAARG